MCQGIIYKATNQINGKVYIGKTIKTLAKRKGGHINTSRSKNPQYFHKELIEEGIDIKNLKWEVIYECDEVMLDMMETFKIMINKAHYTEGGYNRTWGGDDTPANDPETRRKIGKAHKGKIVSEETRKKLSEASKGRKITEETKKKMSKSHMGNKSNTGRKLTDEHKQNIGKSTKGKIVSEETKQKISKTLKGHIVTDETRKRMSETMKGKKLKQVV
jgi:group I intron endonuclease